MFFLQFATEVVKSVEGVSLALRSMQNRFLTETDRVLFPSSQNSPDIASLTLDTLRDQRKLLHELPQSQTDFSRSKEKFSSGCFPLVRLDFDPARVWFLLLCYLGLKKVVISYYANLFIVTEVLSCVWLSCRCRYRVSLVWIKLMCCFEWVHYVYCRDLNECVVILH